jgi:hypothetical protein
MSKAICIMGESGSGKTTAMRTLNPDETYYIDCDGKGLSWKGWRSQYNAEKKNYLVTDKQNTILTVMQGINAKRPNIKNIVIDTINSVMIADERRRQAEKNYDKWADLAWAVYDIVTMASKLREDLTVIVLAHTQTEVDDTTGERFTRILTNGKKLNKIGLEKYFTTVLLTKKTADGFVFETTANKSTAKTPMGAFESDEVPNNMQSVLDALADF